MDEAMTTTAPNGPRYHLRASGALALWRYGDDTGPLVMFQPTYHQRGLVLPGGGLEEDEIPEDAATREVWEETGLYREPRRLLVIESFRADPTRHVPKPAGENFIFEVDPLTADEWKRIQLPPKELSAKFLVPHDDFGALKISRAVQRRIRCALQAQATDTLLRLEPLG